MRSCSDSSAARGVLIRLGTGKLRHLELKHLWVQKVVARKEVEIHWISPQRNPADVLTHQSSLARVQAMSPTVGARVPARYSGRVSVRGRVLECADAKGRWSSRLLWGVKQSLNSGRLCSESVCLCLSWFFFGRSCLREPCGSAQSQWL